MLSCPIYRSLCWTVDTKISYIGQPTHAVLLCRLDICTSRGRHKCIIPSQLLRSCLCPGFPVGCENFLRRARRTDNANDSDQIGATIPTPPVGPVRVSLTIGNIKWRAAMDGLVVPFEKAAPLRDHAFNKGQKRARRRDLRFRRP